MRPNLHYADRDSAFWAYAKLLSEQLGYSKGDAVLHHSEAAARAKLRELGIRINEALLGEALSYLSFRAEVLNEFVRKRLMTMKQARAGFREAREYYTENGFTSDLPLNKQKHEKKDYAYFTGIINILTEKALREYAKSQGLVYGEEVVCDFNPTSLSYILSPTNELEGIMSRRFDGAFPSTVNPKLIWEIKEYYYTTTFGSRIADGVYETQLDGHEIKAIREETSRNVYHIYFIDDYNTWWNMGKSYLCRIIDMLHMGLVDEVIFGREVFKRWPKVLQGVLDAQRESRVKEAR